MTQSSLENPRGPTGDPRVDAAVARLDDLESLDLPAQLEVFTELHGSLATILDSQHEDAGRNGVDPGTAPPAAS